MFALLLSQAAAPAFAFSTTVISGELATLTSAQILDIKNACVSLNLGSASYCKSVSQKAIGVTETGEPDLTLTVAETKGRRLLTTFAGAVLGAEVYGVAFTTLSGDGNFAGPADYIIPKSWGTIYFENGQKSATVFMKVEIAIDTSPPPPPGSISGVTTAGGNPIKQVSVTATMQGNPGVTGQAVSNSNGQYSIGGLPPGTYDIDATASSYYPLHISGVAVASETDTPVDLGLTILPCSERPVKDFIGVAFIDDLLARREVTGGTTTTDEYVTESMRHIKSNGFTGIRVPYYWEAFVYNSTEFMDRIEFIAQTAQDRGICVFYDNHHFYTTSIWNLIDGKTPGRGFPSFVVKDFANVNNDYIQTAGPFWDAYLTNSILIDGVPVWDVQADFFRTIINRVDNYESVAGYEILNEPHFFDSTFYDKLGAYHTFMAGEIRKSTDKKIFFDRENTWGFPRDPNLEPKTGPTGVTGIVYAPHLYAIPYPGSQAETQIQNFVAWSQQWGSEILIGEMAPDTQADADQFLTVLKDNEIGWTVWSWKTAVSTGLGRTYYESDTVEATDVLKMLVAAMANVY